MMRTSLVPHANLRGLEAVLLVALVGFVLDGLLGRTRRRRDQRQQVEALHTWEGEGGTVNAPPDSLQTPR